MGRRRVHDRVIPRRGAQLACAVACLLLPALGNAQAPSPDDALWAGIEAHEVVVFPPGQSSWEWNLTKADHSGGPKIRKGKSCGSCHLDEEAKMGALMATGEKIEPNPIGARPSIPLEIKLAHDDQNLLMRLEWPDVATPGPKPMDPKRDAMLTVMLADGSDKSSKIGGCWATCHDDVDGMPSAAAGSELTKYLGASRVKLSRKGGGERYKSDAELAGLMSKGKFLEYWQVSLRGGGISKVADGIILEKRKENATAMVEAAATRKGGRWRVTLSRPLAPKKDGHHDLAPGRTYVIGIALHDDHSEGRYHHVSFGRTLALDSGDADLVVKRQ